MLNKLLILPLLSLTLSGCGAIYSYEHILADGSSCKVSIYSLREVQAGSLNIKKNCTTTGGADSLTINEKSIEAITSLINKIP